MDCRCSLSFKKTLATVLLFILLLFLLDSPGPDGKASSRKGRTLRQVFEERRSRMESYCNSHNQTRFWIVQQALIYSVPLTRPQTPLRELLPPKKPNFHILENLKRPILLCAPKKVSAHFPFLMLEKEIASWKQLARLARWPSFGLFSLIWMKRTEPAGSMVPTGRQGTNIKREEDLDFLKVIQNFPVRRSFNIHQPCVSWWPGILLRGCQRPDLNRPYRCSPNILFSWNSQMFLDQWNISSSTGWKNLLKTLTAR